MKKINRLQYITTTAELAEKACSSGIGWIQLRLKNTTYETYKATALEVQAVCKAFNATFIINDNAALAAEVQADGVHLGKQDMPVAAARKILGDTSIIGATANTAADIAFLSTQPVDYIGLGPFRFTTTKQNLSPVLGLEGYQQIFTALAKSDIVYPPVIAIGGILPGDLETLMQTGIHGVAVSGVITDSKDTGATVRSLQKHVTVEIYD